jgi:hypothetical protein
MNPNSAIDVCVICVADLNTRPTITLACAPNHTFHADCLERAVDSAGNTPVDTGTVTAQGDIVWRVMPPCCPLCRTRFAAAAYWPHLAYLDVCPDDGFDHLQQEDNDQANPTSDVESDTESSPYVTNPLHCPLCGQSTPHTEYSADDFLAQTNDPDPTCHICHEQINPGDQHPVLTCGHCFAPAHYHD